MPAESSLTINQALERLWALAKDDSDDREHIHVDRDGIIIALLWHLVPDVAEMAEKIEADADGFWYA